jgi:hypothetical protein
MALDFGIAWASAGPQNEKGATPALAFFSGGNPKINLAGVAILRSHGICGREVSRVGIPPNAYRLLHADEMKEAPVLANRGFSLMATRRYASGTSP